MRRSSQRLADARSVTRLAWPVAVAFAANSVRLLTGCALRSIVRRAAERRKGNEIGAVPVTVPWLIAPARRDELRVTQLQELKDKRDRRERAKIAPRVVPPIVALDAVRAP